MIEIPVDLGARRYAIHVGHGIADLIPDLLASLGGRRTIVVSSPRVWSLHGRRLERPLRSLGRLERVLMPDGERHKSRATLDSLHDAFVEAGLGRDGLVVAFGGGVVGDVAGFAAATYMRGVDVVHVPTTLLALVDSSVGGKVGINHPKAKNLIGAFHQPKLVVVDPDVVRTLPEREFRSGLAEIVKHGIVLERIYFDEVERDAAPLLARRPDVLERIIGGSCRLKASVIERDPEEKSELRFALNYGHTIGHALETTTGYERWTHGEAVSLGIVAEAHLARRLGLADEATVTRQERLLAGLGLPVRAGQVDVDAVLSAITHDKKARDGRVPFVLAPHLGEFRVVYDVPPAEIRAALRALAA